MAQPKHKAIVVAVPFDTWQRLAWLADASGRAFDDMVEAMLIDFAEPTGARPADVVIAAVQEPAPMAPEPKIRLPKLPPEISDKATEQQAATALRLFKVSKFDTASIARLLNLTEAAVYTALRRAP